MTVIAQYSGLVLGVILYLKKYSSAYCLAVGGIIFNFIYWGFGFLRMGTTGLTAQAYGTKDDVQVFLILMRTLLIALAAALLLILSQKLIATVSFSLIKTTPEVKQFAEEYFYIRIYAAPATLALYALHGWFLGVQNAKYPLILTVFVNVLNVIFNLIFVYKLGMKADGVALIKLKLTVAISF